MKDFRGIDPTLFFDDDGKVYYATNEGMGGKRGIVAGEIDINTGKRTYKTRFNRSFKDKFYRGVSRYFCRR